MAEMKTKTDRIQSPIRLVAPSLRGDCGFVLELDGGKPRVFQYADGTIYTAKDRTYLHNMEAMAQAVLENEGPEGLIQRWLMFPVVLQDLERRYQAGEIQVPDLNDPAWRLKDPALKNMSDVVPGYRLYDQEGE